MRFFGQVCLAGALALSAVGISACSKESAPEPAGPAATSTQTTTTRTTSSVPTPRYVTSAFGLMPIADGGVPVMPTATATATALTPTDAGSFTAPPPKKTPVKVQ